MLGGGGIAEVFGCFCLPQEERGFRSMGFGALAI